MASSWDRLAYICCLLLGIVTLSAGLLESDLFPHGKEQQVLQVNQDDFSSPEIPLSVPIIFYGTEYRTIYINDNGILSFLTEVPSFFNAQFPLTYPIIAPLYSDVDTRNAGRIYYRETQEADLLERAAQDIRSHFSGASFFQPLSLLIVTWKAVGYFERGADKVNTFQVVIATNGEDSYAYFLYPIGGVQWIQSQGKNPNLPDARAQAGFMSGDGRLYTLRGSGTDQARNFDRMSNMKKAGTWLFHIGRPKSPEGNVLPPDMDATQGGPDERAESQLASSCADTLLPCPPHSTCVDHVGRSGFCCVCKQGYIGNGRNCVEKDKPQRMNGKVNGVVNEVSLRDTDLHSYIVTEDGRTYTALSRVQPDVGSDLQVLTQLAGVVGWLFAVSRSGAPNGFTITGGAFNRSVEVDFPQSGHHVYIEEHFLGPDVFNYMRVQVKLRGTVPSVPVGSKIEIPDYEEEYTRISPGVIRSHSSRFYRLEGNNLEVPFTMDQTINFEECAEIMSSMRLKVARNFIVYDPQEQIVRYAMTNKISPLSVEDPCREGRHQCGPNSNCVAEGDSFQCVCNQGYQQIYESESPVCVDVDECAIGRHNCHVHAECNNVPGSFLCRCNPGYYGNGVLCERRQSCSDIRCDPHADCVEGGGREAPRCVCRVGYVGNGHTCDVTQEDDCRTLNYCDTRADCAFDAQSHRHRCKCRRGFTGDGIVCVEDSCDVADNCSPEGSCIFDAEGESYYCACRPGYSGDGYICVAEDSSVPCDVVNDCHPHAQCLYDSQAQRHQCLCNAGYRGDGKTCSKVEELTCDTANICSQHAVCFRDEYSGRYLCRCNEGFHGDGRTCESTDECNSVDNCDPNAQCLFDTHAQRFRCECLPGFHGTGGIGHCVIDHDVTCDVRNTCHEHATCYYEPEESRYKCQCNPGYNGDGTRCEKAPVPCNVINSCNVKAECTYDQGYRAYRCRCLDGYEGDGFHCRALRSCREDRYLCDRNADCLPSDASGEYACICKQGFVGDGVICAPVAHYTGGFLVFAHGMSLLRVPTTPTKTNPGQLLLMEPNQTPVGLAVDCQMGHLYWADASLRVIRKANYNGSDVTRVIADGMVSPEGIAIDWLGRTIYWTDSGKDTIEVATLNEHGYRKTLISKDLNNPRGIAVHPGYGKLYWTDWDRISPKIETANMDGSGRSELVKGNLGLPNMVVIDFARNNLCWTDSGQHRIECVSLNGQSRRVVYTPAAYPFGIAVHEGYIYWTDWEIKFLHRVDVNGGTAEPLEIPAGGSGKMYGLVSLPSTCPAVTSPCAVNNGGCRYLCLPDGRGGRSCVCPESSEIPEEEIHCADALR